MRLNIFLAIATCMIVVGCTPIPSFAPEYQEMQSQGAPLAVIKKYPSYPNSAGGVDVQLSILNLSPKTIKYLDYTITSFNAVGDRVLGEISRSSKGYLKDTGPIEPDALSESGWGNVWYNYSIRCYEISHIKVRYMDGTSQTFGTRSSINKLIRSDVSNSCRV